MKFLVSVIDSTTNSGTGDEMAAIDAFNDSLEANGHWIIAGGLTAPSHAIRFDNRDGAGVIVDGPLHEPDPRTGNEYVSGFWLIEAPDEETARRLAAEGSRACNRKVELRPLLGR